MLSVSPGLNCGGYSVQTVKIKICIYVTVLKCIVVCVKPPEGQSQGYILYSIVDPDIDVIGPSEMSLY